ncbi:GNAT family N-acetyltransferase [Georgenia sp. Z1344]|uniref:GNAT family N-acetyltransferase n=1 Tax=Georgenia sp. Z1344 TaxID=3416706 RepID=UPI003CEDE221
MSDHHDDVLSSLAAGRTPEGLPTTSRGGPDVSVRPTLAGDADALGAIHATTMRAALAVGAGIDADDDALAVIAAGDLGLAWADAAAVTEPGHHVLTALDGTDIVGLAAIAPVAPATDEEAEQLAPPASAESAAQARAADDSPAESAAQVGDAAPAAPSGHATPADHAAPTDDAAPSEALEAARRGTLLEILALEIRPGDERVGHGSRLLAACADLARDSGATALATWVVRGDEPRQRFLDTAGFAPTGRRREIPVGSAEAVQDEWWASLGEQPTTPRTMPPADPRGLTPRAGRPPPADR